MKTIRSVMSSSAAFVDYMLVAAWSVLRSLDPAVRLELSVLHCGIPDETAATFSAALGKWENVGVEFINVLPRAERYGFTLEQIEKLPTCFPLLAGELFPEEEKVLSLDSDLIVRRDLSELWDVPLGDALLAAVVDADFNGQFRSGNRRYQRYYSRTAPMPDPLGYIQAGVILYHLKELRARFQPGELFSEAISGRYQYDDQDVLNMYCAGRVLYLDMRWNVIHNNLGYRVPYIISLAEKSVKEGYLASREEPWIIHYAGSQKPWNDKDCDFAEAFWEVAAETPVYERLERRYAELDRAAENKKNSLIRRAARLMRFLVRRTRLCFKAEGSRAQRR